MIVMEMNDNRLFTVKKSLADIINKQELSAPNESAINSRGH